MIQPAHVTSWVSGGHADIRTEEGCSTPLRTPATSGSSAISQGVDELRRRLELQNNTRAIVASIVHPSAFFLLRRCSIIIGGSYFLPDEFLQPAVTSQAMASHPLKLSTSEQRTLPGQSSRASSLFSQRLPLFRKGSDSTAATDAPPPPPGTHSPLVDRAKSKPRISWSPSPSQEVDTPKSPDTPGPTPSLLRRQVSSHLRVGGARVFVSLIQRAQHSWQLVSFCFGLAHSFFKGAQRGKFFICSLLTFLVFFHLFHQVVFFVHKLDVFSCFVLFAIKWNKNNLKFATQPLHAVISAVARGMIFLLYSFTLFMTF